MKNKTEKNDWIAWVLFAFIGLGLLFLVVRWLNSSKPAEPIEALPTPMIIEGATGPTGVILEVTGEPTATPSPKKVK